MVILETERLLINEWQEKDILQIAPIYEDEEVMKHTFSGVLDYEGSKEKVEGYIKHQEDYGFGIWALIKKETGKIIGHAGIEYIREVHNEISVNVLVNKTEWGNGFGLEAMKSVIEYAFQELDIDYLIGIAKPLNVHCTRVFEKLQMKHRKEAMYFDTFVTFYDIEKGDVKWEIFRYLK